MSRRSNSSLSVSEPPRITTDGRLRERVEIAISWKKSDRGLVVEALDLTPAPFGKQHRPHDITVYAGLLRCDCTAYEFDPWSPSHPKECKHLVGNDGLDGAANWLEVQSKRSDLSFYQRAIISASHSDPHRSYVRAERARRRRRSEAEVEPVSKPAPAPAPEAPKRASAARGHTLEEFFSN